ncbi:MULTISPECIES: NAD-dependent epimerase/dehydratase family protein [Acetobacteraceae]|uniref:NAD-dependent epimerase/dehydratase family protein n=1 Tax=Acetobacteraceae TaxID=433 RepID=UPI000ADE4556|nr:MULTISPECIES: NAD-dependent epimerase/dehydratase family protein [Acetobacteraceae]GCE81161.1 hypothetical protein MSKU3_2636 [Komagataeibacter oboediens]
MPDDRYRIRASVVRLPQVHDRAKQGLITPLIETFRQNGTCAYVGDGSNLWPAAHVLDVARLYRLAIEKGATGAAWHAVAEEGVAMRDIVETLGRRLDLPVRPITPDEAAAFFGRFDRDLGAMNGYLGHRYTYSSAKAQSVLGWKARPLEETVVDCGRSLITIGAV